MARKRLIAIVLAIALVVSLVVAAASSGLGDPSVPDGDVAIVQDAPGGPITSEDFQLGLEQQAAQNQVKQVPKPGDQTYDQLKQATMGDLLLSRWVEGEAQEQDIEVSDREVDQQLDDIAKQQFGGTKGFEKFLRTSGFCTDEELQSEPLTCQGARDRVRLQIITDDLQKKVLDDLPDPSSEEISDYYNANLDMFKTPETRDVRLVLNSDAKKVEAAAKALQADDSDASWKKVAKKYSSDQATSGSGGLRQSVVQGQSGDQAFDAKVFSSAPNEVVGPFPGQGGSYVIEVEKVNPAATTSLSDASDQIKQTLQQSQQQLAASNFQSDFLEKWRSRSICAEDYAIDRCANYEAPPPQCSYQVENPDDCGDAPVVSTRPVAPGTAGVIGAGAPATGLPQGPHGVTPPAAAGAAGAGGLPAGLAPQGAAPQGAAPQGSVPQGAVPQGAAPQGSVPQGSVPQGAAPQQTAPASP